MPISSTESPGVMRRLKAETADLHRAAETSRFQRALVQGRLDRAPYAAWLAQMRLVHDAMEQGLREAEASAPPVAHVNRRDYDRKRFLDAISRQYAGAESVIENGQRGKGDRSCLKNIKYWTDANFFLFIIRNLNRNNMRNTCFRHSNTIHNI